MEKFEEGLKTNHLKDILLGLNGYTLPSRYDELLGLQAYDILLKIFDEYNKKYPEDGLKAKYSQALEELLKSEIPYQIICGTTCSMTQFDMEKRPDFDFKISNTEEMLKLARQRLAEKKEDILEMVSGAASQTIAPRYYTSLSNEVEEKVGSLGMM